jgi:hypothetical protein
MTAIFQSCQPFPIFVFSKGINNAKKQPEHSNFQLNSLRINGDFYHFQEKFEIFVLQN